MRGCSFSWISQIYDLPDGDGCAPSLDILTRACVVLALLECRGVPTPFLYPDPDGYVLAEWDGDTSDGWGGVDVVFMSDQTRVQVWTTDDDPADDWAVIGLAPFTTIVDCIQEALKPRDHPDPQGVLP